jgi:hypothetical protein
MVFDASSASIVGASRGAGRGAGLLYKENMRDAFNLKEKA